MKARIKERNSLRPFLGLFLFAQLLKFVMSACLQLSFPFIFVLLHSIGDDRGYRQVPIPLVIGWHDMRGRHFCTKIADGVFIGFLITVPIFALCPITRGELPCLVFVLFTCQQSFFLFIVANMEKEFENNSAISGKQLFKMVDFFIARLPDLLWCQVMHTYYQNILIVRAVEDTHDAFRWRGLMDTPQEVVCQFLWCWDLERIYITSLRVNMR